MRNPSKNTIKRLKRRYPSKFGVRMSKRIVSDFETAKALLWWESIVKWSKNFEPSKK